MPKLRHIALHTPDPEKTAEFYKRVLGRGRGGANRLPVRQGHLFKRRVPSTCRWFGIKPKRWRTGATVWVQLLVCITFGFWVENEDDAPQTEGGGRRVYTSRGQRGLLRGEVQGA